MVPPKIDTGVIFGTSSKSSPWPREQGPTRPGVPRQDGAEKENIMNEETQIQKTEAVSDQRSQNALCVDCLSKSVAVKP